MNLTEVAHLVLRMELTDLCFFFLGGGTVVIERGLRTEEIQKTVAFCFLNNLIYISYTSPEICLVQLFNP